MTRNEENCILLGSSRIHRDKLPVKGDIIQLLGETYYHISHYDQMPPFLMSLVSSSDHWLFISSTGGLTAGRINAESALLPYETEDKIAAHHEETGSKTIIRVKRNGRSHLWEPLSNRFWGVYQSERHLYKNYAGNKLIFEEVNHDLELTFRTGWRTGDRFGFIRTCWLENNSEDNCEIELLDGLLNIIPYGATTALQATMSSLLHAYKRNELDPNTGLGIFSLSATLTDRPEPSESLKATVVWQTGLDSPKHLLSPDQVENFRFNRPLIPEQDICGKPGAYLVNSNFGLSNGENLRWHFAADVNMDSVAVENLVEFLKTPHSQIEAQIEADIDNGTSDLISYVASADGLQMTAEETIPMHHFANVLFNIMRGGTFANGYYVQKDDLLDFLRTRNRRILSSQLDWFAALPKQIHIRDLYSSAKETGISDIIRLCHEYLPLMFSRRHGDPSRPWNRFSISLKQPDGSLQLDYQGNWRDIFQNWEPLALAFPDYLEGLIAKFFNAITADGYNPYRVTRDGVEWEVPEPNNPWSNIGYWSDHQIIYLQKLCEIIEDFNPGTLFHLFDSRIFAYANVPYRLRPYQEMLLDWSNTIDFDWESEHSTEKAVSKIGTDGRLHLDNNGEVVHSTLIEKILVLLLAKLTNLVPEGGIWMNTQRPEWNDANNALVGKGLSIVTVAYLRRFIAFWQERLSETDENTFTVNSAVFSLFEKVTSILASFRPHLETGFTDHARREFMDEMGEAITTYRNTIYSSGIPQVHRDLKKQLISEFLGLGETFVERTLRANRRSDGLYHAYNILTLDEKTAGVENLYLMLEGQVAILSSGLLTSVEVLDLLQKLRQSDLYRADQHSYMLYPNRQLPGFRQKNKITRDQVANSALVQSLTANGDRRLLILDKSGIYHFNGRFRNAGDVTKVLDSLSQEPAYEKLVESERVFILDLFETTFNHRTFTGRSGTFFAYEGLGSIYWHMVSKLLLAVQECYFQAINEEVETAVSDALVEIYYDIRQGLGFKKSPAEYGAFPTDPYSHTPMGGGARQPGMTGHVKEEIMTRWGELGVIIRQGQISFLPKLLRSEEFFTKPTDFTYFDANGNQQKLHLKTNSLVFTVFQTPVVYTLGDKELIEIFYADGLTKIIAGSTLNSALSQHIFDRDGYVIKLCVTVMLMK